MSSLKNRSLQKIGIGILGSIFYFFSIGISGQTLQLTDGKFSSNLLPGDTSFETGLHPVMTGVLSPLGSSYYLGEIDKTIGFDRNQSLRLPSPNSSWSWSFGVPMILKNGETYTFSFYAKAKKESLGYIAIQALNWKQIERKSITFTTEWKRYSVTVKVQEKFYFPIIWSNKNSEIVWVDCLQLEKGSEATPYKNGEPVTVNINFGTESKRIFFSDDKIHAHIIVRKASPDANYKNLNVKYTIMDFYRKIVAEDRIPVSFNDKNIFTKEIDLPAKELGTFLINYQLENDKQQITNQASDTYAIINQPVKIKDGVEAFCGYDARETTLRNLKAVGVKWTQIIRTWSSVEKEKGKFDWSEMDAIISSLEKEGFQIKAVLGFKIPKWACEPLDLSVKDKMSPAQIARSQHDTLPANLEDWRNFVSKFTERYHNKVDLYEIGAEADLAIGDNPYYRIKYPESVKGRFVCGGPVIDKYVRMIEIAAEEIRKLNPEAKIGAVRASNVDCDVGFPFSAAVFEKAGKYLNRLPMDPYTGPRLIGKGCIETRDPEYLDTVFKNATALIEKHRSVRNMYVSELAWYYDITAGFMTEYAEQGTKKIIRSCLLSRMTPKMAYWHQMGGNSSYCQYTNYMCAWGFYPTILVPAYSMAAQIVENVNSVKEIKLNQLVKSAVFEKGDCAAGAIWSTDNYKRVLEIAPLKDLAVIDMIGNPVKTEIKDDKLSIPIDGFPVYFILKGNNCADKLFQSVSQGKIRGIPVKPQFRPVTFNQGEILMENLTDNRLKGKVNILAEGQKQLELNAEIPVAESRTFKFTLNTDLENTQKIKVESVFTGEDKVTAGFTLEPVIKCKKVSSPIKIDGDMKKWENHPFILMNKRTQIEPSDPWIPWAGSEYFSAKIYIGWDENALYMAAEVTDDEHFNNQKERRIWNGDSIQVAFDFGNDATLKDKLEYDDNDMDFVMALTANGVSSYHLPEKSKLAVVRNGSKTCYELSIPKTAFPADVTLSSGSMFGFNFVIFNDNDGVGQTYYYYLSRGITEGKAPRLFKKIILTE